jgi:hypothetical protein
MILELHMEVMVLAGKQSDGLFLFLVSSCLLDHSAYALRVNLTMMSLN